MSAIRDLLERVRTLVFRGREDADLDEELRFHLDMEAAARERAGLSADQARRASVLALGGVEQTKDHVRDARGTRWIEDLSTDVTLAFRAVRRAPAFATVAIGMLAVGIGANTAIFTLVNALVVSSLPVPRPQELIAIGDPSMVNSSGVASARADSLSYPLYLDIRNHVRSLSGVLASGPAGRLDALIGSSAELEHPTGRFVSGNYFSVLAIPAWRGRVFDATEDRSPGSSPVAVISHAYWTRRFQQDPAIVGRSLRIDNANLTIVGVTPPGFAGEVVGESTDVWVPITMHDVLNPARRRLERRNAVWLLALGRLAPGATLVQARAELTPFMIRTVAQHAAGSAGQEFLASNPQVPIAAGHNGFSKVRDTFQTPLVTLMAGVGLLLCIICANVANLLLARAVARGKEMAVRLALGARRGRLVRLLLTESLVLALFGGAAGLLLAWWGSSALLIMAADGDTIAVDLSLDWRVLCFTLVVSSTAVVLFGLAPALRASSAEPMTTLRANGRAVVGNHARTRDGRPPIGGLLIAGQVALSVVLLVGAAMLTRSLRNVQSVDVGLDRDRLLILDVDIAAAGYAGDRLGTLARTLHERLSAIPGVTAVAYSENGIFLGSEWSSEIRIPGGPERDGNASRIGTDVIGPNFVQSIGGRVLEGRELTDADLAGQVRVAVVNQSFATFYFPGESAVGKSFDLPERSIEIVGVVADVRAQNLDAPVRRRAYFPYVPADEVANPLALRFAIHTSGDPETKTIAVRRAVSSIDPSLPIDSLRPLTTLMRRSIREERMVVQLASVFGVLALLLASVGLYGVMTYAVRRRTGEIGLRVALGAERSAIMRLVLVDASRLVALGMIAGVPLALGLTRSLGAQLHGVPAIDPVSIGLALTALATSAVVAAVLPALTASRVSPIVALQAE